MEIIQDLTISKYTSWPFLNGIKPIEHYANSTSEQNEYKEHYELDQRDTTFVHYLYIEPISLKAPFKTSIVYCKNNLEGIIAKDLKGQTSTKPVAASVSEKLTFPTPRKLKDGTQTAFCIKTRVLKLFNKYNNCSQQRLTSTVKNWFITEALQQGWADAIATPANQTGTEEGILLIAPNNKLVNDYQTVIVAVHKADSSQTDSRIFSGNTDEKH